MGRKKKRIDKGEAISMEDALSMLVVVFVLFVVFLVPLVSMEKNPQFDNESKDPFWNTAINSLLDTQSDNIDTPYNETMGLHKNLHTRITKHSESTIIEYLTVDSTLVVIEHIHDVHKYSSIIVQNRGSSVIYKWGLLEWNTVENEWISLNDSTHYYKNPITEKIEYEYRQWIRKLNS